MKCENLGCGGGAATILPPEKEGDYPVLMAGRGSCRGHAALGQSCPVSDIQYPADLNCMRDARGNAVCSNGMIFPPGCPKTPPDQFFTPGVTPDEIRDGAIQGKIPPPRGAVGSAIASAGISPVAAGLGLLAIAGGIGAFLYYRR